MSDPGFRRVREDRPEVSRRRLVAVIAVPLVLIALVGLAYVSAAPLPGPVRQVTRELFPQGWAVFTRQPDIGHLLVARPGEDGWHFIDQGPLAEPRNAFGLNKEPIARAEEIRSLDLQLPAVAGWPVCRGRWLACLERFDTDESATVTNRRDPAKLCGPLGFVWRPPVPWDRARRGEGRSHPDQKPVQVMVAEVECP